MKKLITNKIEKIADDEKFKIMEYRGQKTNYIISNYGRVFNKKTGKLKTKTIKQAGTLNTVFRFYGKNVSCLTSKLVINNFVNKIDFNDKYLRVVHLDGDKNNVKYDNIVISNVSDKIVYSEKKIREICELLQEGTKSIKTISLMTDTPYRMVYNLFIKASRKNITKDYTFSCFTPEDKIEKDEYGNIKYLPIEKIAEDEIFKPLYLKGFQTIYFISNYGRVFSSRRNKEITPYWNERYNSWFVTIFYNYTKGHFSLPRLIFCHFNEEFDITNDRVEIGYEDGNRNNYKYDNLKIIRTLHTYSTKQIKEVCKLLEQGMGYKKIYNKTLVKISTIQAIRGRRIHQEISKKYNF